jgi:hypothetical protein
VAGLATFNKEKPSNLQCISIYWEECAWEILHFVQIVYLTVTVQFKQFIYTIPQTNCLPPLKSSKVLSQCDTCHWQLKIFFDVLYPAVHSWLLTADLLWCWRLTRPPLCRICAGVDRGGATDIKGKHVGSFGSSEWLNYRQCRQCRHCRPRRHCKQVRHCRQNRHCRQIRHCRQRIIKLQALEAIQAIRAILAKALQTL